MTTNVTQKSTTTSDSNQQPLETIREGAVAASIWSRQSSAGHDYLEFSLSRSWKSKSGDKEGYSQNFFENNEEALVKVVTDACRYMRAQQTQTAASDASSAPISDELEQA